jgi:hypothetical protein
VEGMSDNKKQRKCRSIEDRKRDELHHQALTHDRRRKKYISFDNFGTEISISQNG